MSKYTENMVAEMESIGSFTYETAKEYAEVNGLKLRSVIAKAKSLGLEYTAKPVVTKSGEPVVHKSEMAAEINAALNLNLTSLVKMTKAELEVLVGAVGRNSVEG